MSCLSRDGFVFSVSDVFLPPSPLAERLKVVGWFNGIRRRETSPKHAEALFLQGVKGTRARYFVEDLDFWSRVKNGYFVPPCRLFSGTAMEFLCCTQKSTPKAKTNCNRTEFLIPSKQFHCYRLKSSSPH